MCNFSNLDLGFKFSFGKRYFERESTRSTPSRVEIRTIFRGLSDLYKELDSKFKGGQQFQIEMFDGENTVVICSEDIASIEIVTKEQNILEIRLKLYRNQTVVITNPGAVSIVYVETPVESRLNADAKEVQCTSVTIGDVLTQIFGSIEDLQVRELTLEGLLDLQQRNPNSSSVLIIVEKDSMPNGLKTLEEFLKIKIVEQYQGTNLPNIWILSMSMVKQIKVEGKPNFINVTWKKDSSSTLEQMVFPLFNYCFFVVIHPKAEATAIAKPGIPKGPLATERQTLRDFLLQMNSSANLADENIEIICLSEKLERNSVLLRNDYQYYLVIIESSLLEELQGSSVLDLQPNFSSERISQQCNVVALSSLEGVRVKYLRNTLPFGIKVFWSGGHSMIYPIQNYSFFLIGIPNSDEDLLARLLQQPFEASTSKPFNVEQLILVINTAFGPN